MGIVMGVPLAELEMIRLDPMLKSVTDRETAMIESWLKASQLPQNWQVLVDAVQHQAGGNHRLLAKQIASELE